MQLGRPMIVADLVATFLFALQGGATAAAAGLDVFGILVVAFVVALGGGVVVCLVLRLLALWNGWQLPRIV